MIGGISSENLTKIMGLNAFLMNHNLGLGEKIIQISEVIKGVVKAERCSVFVHDKTKKRLWTVHSDGVSYFEIPDEKGIAGLALRTKTPQIDNDVKLNQNFFDEIDKMSGYETKNIIAYPVLAYDGRAIGVVEFLNSLEKSGFDDEDLKVIKFVINHISAFIELVSDNG